MRKNKIKSLLFILPALTVTTIATGLTTIGCSKKDKKEDYTIKGTVCDTNGKALKDVNVSCNGTSVKTDANGQYTITFEKATDVIYFEKYGFIGEARTNLTSDQSWDIKLYEYYKGEKKLITLNVEDAFANSLTNCSVTFFPESELYRQQFFTDSRGQIHNVEVVVPPSEASNFNIPYVINHKGLDYSTKLLQLVDKQVKYKIVADAYQYDIKAFVSEENESNNIIMHAYRRVNEDGSSNLEIKLVSNFVAAFYKEDPTKQYLYKLSFCVGKDQSNPNIDFATANNYFSITFNSSYVLSAKGNALSTQADINDIVLNYDENVNKNLLTITIPNKFYNFNTTDNDVIGLHLASVNKDDAERYYGKFEPFGHAAEDTTSHNQLSYVRLGSKNEFFASSCNEMSLDGNQLAWDIDNVDGWNVAKYLPEGAQQPITSFDVGPKYNFGYQVKFATNINCPNGFFVLTKYQQDQMSSYLNDIYMPHFFIDSTVYDTESGYPSQTGFIQENVGNISHFAPYSGYWMKKFRIQDVNHPFVDEKGYNEFYTENGTHVYSKDDLMVTYIAYADLSKSAETVIDDITDFSITCNLQYHYTGGEWFGWNGINPSGYSTIPHFEDLSSYIRFEKRADGSLYIKPYSNL